MASRVDPSKMESTSSSQSETEDPARDPAACVAYGAGESSLGLPTDPGRAEEAGIEISASSIRRIICPKRRPGTEAGHLVPVHAKPGGLDHRLRSLYRWRTVRLKPSTCSSLSICTPENGPDRWSDRWGHQPARGAARSPVIFPRHGSPAISQSTSSSTTVKSGSAPPSTRCSRQRGSGSCAHRGERPERMPMPSDSFGLSALNASTGSSSSTNVTCGQCSRPMSIITTGKDHTGVATYFLPRDSRSFNPSPPAQITLPDGTG